METLKLIFVGAVVALITAFINQTVANGVNYWLVGGVGFGTITLIFVFLKFPGDPDFKKWRVTEDEKELRATKEFTIKEKGKDGQPDKEVIVSFNGNFTNKGGAWYFTAKESPAYPIYGPYLKKKKAKKSEEKEEKPLRKGKYRAEFKMKVDRLGGENRPIVDLDIASSTRALGDKRLAGRTLTSDDFRAADEYDIFSLEFEVISDKGESDLEFRVFSRGSGQRVYVDYVQFSRRLF